MAESIPSPGKGLSYKQMPIRETYALGVHALQRACERDPSCVHPQFTLDDGSQVYRPLTFKENIEARVKDYETLHHPSGRKRTLNERLRLFNQRQDSCTGIVSKAKSTKFKIIPKCKELITIPPDFVENYLSTPYTIFAGVRMELDSAKGKYNQPLTQTDALRLEGWQAALEKDTSLLRTFARIVFTELERVYQEDTGMGFYVEQDSEKDELRALFVDDLGNLSIASGYSSLYYNGSFLRGSPTSSLRPQGARRVQKHLSPEEQLMEKLRPYLKRGTEQKAGRTIRNFLK